MKKVIALVILAVLLGVAYYGAQPLLALRSLKGALEARDPQAVNRMVDFAALRLAVIGHAHRKIEKANDDRILGGLRDAIEDKLADLKIESLATPDGLIHLVCDKDAKGDVDTSPKAPGTPCQLKGHLAGGRYTSWTRFDALVRREDGDEMTLTMGKQQDGRWQLVDLIGK